MFVVTGVSGNTGSVVADRLLAAGAKVRVVVRSAEKGEPWKARGAEVAVASVEDVDALAAALSGASGAYLLIPPPGPEVQGILARGRRIADGFVQALTRSPVGHVVLLSSVGAQHPDKTGPIAALHHAEQVLSGLAGTRLTFVRAAYFMENLGGMLGAVLGAGVLPSLASPTLSFPMVATKDIGEVAADALLHPKAQPGAPEIIELSGPAEYSISDAAAAFGQALNKAVHAVPVPREGVVPALMQAGLGAEMAGLYLEMSVGMDEGRVAFAGAGRPVRGKVTLAEQVGRLVPQAS